MQCIILCAGFATRLHPLTLNQPKHLLPVGNQCVLDIVLARLAEAHLPEAVVVCNHRFGDHFRQWLRQSTQPLKVRLLDNGITRADQRRGSVGDLHLALEQIDIQQDFLVLHGDNLFTFGLSPLLASFQNRGNTLATYDVQNLARARRAAQVSCNADGRITHLVEKPAKPNGTRVSIGIYAFENAIRRHLNRYLSLGLPADRSGDFMAWLHQQVPLYTHPIPKEAGVWFDIGTSEDYQQARAAITRADGSD